MSINDSSMLGHKDPCPNAKINEISPLGVRAQCLVIRNKHRPQISKFYLNVWGATEMMRGLEYHHANFMCCFSLAAEGNAAAEENMSHELIAYLNRVGQFKAFVRSKFVKNLLGNIMPSLPKVEHVSKIRDKVSAHRSIDSPYPEDTQHLQEVHAIATRCRLWLPKPGRQITSELGSEEWSRQIRENAYLVHQINMGAGGAFEISIERDHPVIITECYSVIDSICK